MNNLAVVILAVWGAVYSQRNQKQKRGKKTHLHWVLMSVIVLLAGCSAAMQFLSSYQHAQLALTDTAAIHYYDDKFSEQFTHKRALAAIAICEYLDKGDWNLVTNNTDGLDEMMGFWDLVGSEVKNRHISPFIAHQYFCGVIEPYYLATIKYVEQTQTNGLDTKATWENIQPLYEGVMQVEINKTGKSISQLGMSKKQLREYFDTEIRAAELKDTK